MCEHQVHASDSFVPARDADKGRKAVEKLQKEGLDPKFMHLDVSAMESIEAAKEELKELYGRLDILVHSAGLLLAVSIERNIANVEGIWINRIIRVLTLIL